MNQPVGLQPHRYLRRKTIASCCFVALGCVGAVFCQEQAVALLVLAGLLLGCLGDILLALRYCYPARHDAYFFSGGLAFFLGHLAYCLALLLRPGVVIWPALAILLLWPLLLCYWRRCGVQLKRWRLPVALYISAVFVMLGLALSLAIFSNGWANWLFACGAAAFVYSDSLLIVDNFAQKKRTRRRFVVLGFYYFAQMLIALSLFFV